MVLKVTKKKWEKWGIKTIKNCNEKEDIIDRCKLPEAIELRKKLGYNHDDIMI